ncbi:MAG TPA: hypothetical protein VM638_04740 [Actinomycetota bacterium]|nr:hypothetical protein [Actinomycetota bacterium]
MDPSGLAVLSGWSVIEAHGADARDWLHDLLTADVESLATGRSAVALLLTPTGRIRASAVVVATEDAILLVQGPGQPRPIADLLEPYVLSSAVELVPTRLVPVARLGAGGLSGRYGHAPSALGAGAGTFLSGDDVDALPSDDLIAPAELERWRVERGVARFPVDLTPESLPHEADFGDAIDLEKGCYLGQEAVARVRNLGHPTRLVLAAEVEGGANAGDAVEGPDGPVGEVTSVAGQGSDAVLIRVRWAAREAPLRLSDGRALRMLGRARGGA